MAWIALSGFGVACAATPDVSPGAALLAQYAALADRLRQNPFQHPLHLESSESDNDVKGDIYAVVDYPFATVSAGLNDPEHWCDVLSLHINTKYCHASPGPSRTVLRVSIGNKYDQPLADAYRLEFNYRVVAASEQYLEIRLGADKGPLGTRNYRIHLRAIPLANGRTFLRMTYFYAYGWTGRAAMNAYLATLGRNKVGFTVTGWQTNGQPEYIQGMRGLVERNAMRYYLAIDAFLGAIAAAPDLRLHTRLQNWYTATERYPLQLHEIERDAYIDMKLSEYSRQRTLQ